MAQLKTGSTVNGVAIATLNDVPDALADLNDDATHRLVTDTEKSDWDSKADGSHTQAETTITFTDVTTNNSSTSAHGFLPKLSNVAGQFLNGVGAWSAPAGDGDVIAPASNNDDYIPIWNGVDSKTLANGIPQSTFAPAAHSQAESSITFTDVATGNASTGSHGYEPKATAPAAGNLNVLGIENGATARTDKLLLDTTTPSTQAYGDSAAAGTGVKAARVDHKHAMPAALTDATIATTDVTTNNATTSKHGWLVKATAPASGLYNYVGITNGETVYTNKALFDATSPTTQALGDAAATGSAAVAARRDHKHAMFSTVAETAVTFTDVTTNNASTTAHGFAPKATAPAAGLISVLAIGNGETARSDKALFDATVPETQAFGDSAATGSATVSARRDHKHAMMAAPVIRSMVFGSSIGIQITAGQTKYLGHGIGNDAYDRAFVIPYACIIKNLYVYGSDAAGAGQSLTFTIMVDNSASGVTCSFSTGNSASDTSNTVSVSAGARVTLRTVSSAAATSVTITFGFETNPQ